MFAHPIYLAALFVSVVLIMIVGTVLWKRSSKKESLLLTVLFFIELPLFFFSTYSVRRPLNAWIDSMIDPQSTLGLVVRSFQAPLIEEPCKLWLLFIVWGFGFLTSRNYLRVAMVIGFAFGISEIWGLAYGITQNPAWANTTEAWYYFAPFMNERLLVAPAHGIFLVFAAHGLVKGRVKSIVGGVLLGMTLHYFANFPILLKRLNVVLWSELTWQVLLSLYNLAYVFFLYGLLMYFAFGKLTLTVLTAKQAQCPNCKKLYRRTRVRLNLGPFLAYERCQECRQMNWIREKDVVV